MEPAAISARPAVTTRAFESTAPETPAASANGTVSPSDIPITMSLTIALAVKCCSTCGVSGMAPHILTISTAASRYPLAMPPEATVLLGAALVFLGFLVGTFGTLIGAGGGFLLVPLLLIGYHFQPPDAVGTSLALVFLNAASGSFAYLRQRRVGPSLRSEVPAAPPPRAVRGAVPPPGVVSHPVRLSFPPRPPRRPAARPPAARRAPGPPPRGPGAARGGGGHPLGPPRARDGPRVPRRPPPGGGIFWPAVGVGAPAVVFSLPPIPQDAAYHQFADRRPMLGLPNALNVLSNFPFVVVGILGLARVARAGAGWERLAFLVLFARVELTGVGY